MSRNLPISEVPDIEGEATIVIITAEWNSHITSQLERGAIETLHAHGVLDKGIIQLKVPGAVELTYAAALAIEQLHPDAVIVFGAVVRGDTPHFDYVCQSVILGVTQLNAKALSPVIFGVLTVDNEQQALDRIGGPSGHKGIEAAETALKMIELKNLLELPPFM